MTRHYFDPRGKKMVNFLLLRCELVIEEVEIIINKCEGREEER